MERITQFSPCRKYRYTLWREWHLEDCIFASDPESISRLSGSLVVIGLNPSTADETQDDPTIRRCIGFAKTLGFGALCMANLFAGRATKPEDMKKLDNPAGIDNHHWLLKSASEPGMVVAAWGRNGSFRNQDITVRQLLGSIGVNLYCLKKNSDGSPAHPLYIPASTIPIPYP
jgi:hypothetical protein